MMPVDSNPASQSVPDAAPSAPRAPFWPSHDLYGVVHKGLRWAMFRALEGVARIDPDDVSARDVAVAQVRELLELLESHLQHENEFIHAALEARRPGASARIAGDHAHHQRSLDELAKAIREVEQSSVRERAASWRSLYLALSVFVGENLVHMEEEENLVQPVLEAVYSVEELAAIEAELVSHVPPDRLLRFVRYMLVAIPLQARVALLAGPRAEMPPEVFADFFAAATTLFTADERAELRRRIWEDA